MICPKCEAEYTEGIKECADCNIELIPKDQFEGNLVQPSDWITVFTTNAIYEAEMLKTNLESADIETTIIKQKDSSLPVVGDLSVIKINVRKRDIESAVLIIKDMNINDTDTE